MAVTTPTVPQPVGSDPIDVQEKTIKQFDCPNPDCEEKLDITNINTGTKIKCGACENVTWLPDYRKKWWQKPASILGGLLISFMIGLLSSMTADYISNDLDSNEESASSEEIHNKERNEKDGS